MGLLKWFKREIDTPNSCKRRRSAPPISIMASSSLSSEYPRDEAYIKALSKFNEWRNKQKFGNFVKTYRKNSRKEKENNHKTIRKDGIFVCNTKEIRNNKFNKRVQSNEKKLKNIIYQEIESVYSSRNSLSCPSKLTNAKKIQCNGKIKMGSKSLGGKFIKKLETETFENEIDDCEENDFCSQIEQTNFIDDYMQNVITSPPAKFYKENSNPFNNANSPEYQIKKHSVFYSSQKSLNSNNSLCDQNIKKRKIVKRISKTTPKSPMKIYEKNSDNSYEKCHTNTNTSPSISSVYSQIIRKNNKSQDTPCDDDKHCIISSEYRFQTVVNKHGDLVEYAVPYAVPLNKSDENLDTLETYGEMKQNNFEMDLESNPKYLLSEQHLGKIESYVNTDLHLKENVIVTDLDKSEEEPKKFNEFKIDDDIISQLQSLEQWSQNINLIPNTETSKNISKCHEKDLSFSGTFTCSFKDLKSRITSFRNSFKCPIIYQSGIFRTTPVSLFLIDDTEKQKTGTALQANYLILRKLRHPNIPILMAVCVTKTNDIISLILESFEHTIHDVLHKNRIELPLENCVEYILQIICALKYMHESKMIHSNISSHAILINKNHTWVKLSAFELTTTTTSNDVVEKELAKYENINSKFDEPKLFREQLPYWIEYRKIYSQHFYQSPELISTTKTFVFPTIKSDVYGISLTLWELLNNRIPFELLNYNDLENFHNSNQTKLYNSLLKTERCKLFESIIIQGLCSRPEDRFENINKIKEHVENIKLNAVFKESGILLPLLTDKKLLRSESDSLIDFSKISKAKSFESNDAYDEQVSRPRYIYFSGKKLFQDEKMCSSKMHRVHKQNTKSVKTVKKVLKDDVSDLNTSETKKLNISICVTQNTFKNKISIDDNKFEEKSNEADNLFPISSPPLQITKTDVANQIKYWNSLTSPNFDLTKTDKSKLSKNSSLKNDSNEIVPNSGKKRVDSPKILNKNVKEFLPSNHQELLNFQESLKNFFNKQKLNDNDFENMFWKREKERCERISPRSIYDNDVSGVITPLRASVKETIYKFENYLKCRDCKNIKENANEWSFNANMSALLESTRLEEFSITNSTTASIEVTEDYENVKVSSNHSENISRLNVILRNKSDDQNKRNTNNLEKRKNLESSPSEEFQKLSKRTIEDDVPVKQRQTFGKQPILFSLNLQKLNRRVSDLGYSVATKPIARKYDNVRHSISGTEEVFNKLVEIPFLNARKINDKSFLQNNFVSETSLNVRTKQLSDNIDSSEMWIRKLKCWNCGCHIFSVNGIEKKESLQISSNSNANEIIKTDHTRTIENPLHPSLLGTIPHNAASIEDLYIDDDFKNELGELCANIELGTEEQQFSDFIDFDILSAEILSKLN